MASATVPRPSAAREIAELLDSPELVELTAELEALRETGRRGYGARALLGACLVKSIYAIPTWSRAARLIAEHVALQDALGSVPSVYACYRFAAKLRENQPTLDACFQALAASIRRERPEYGHDLAIDASDLPAYANGQRFVSKNGPERERFSDPDASWGHRSAVSTRKGGGFYGYKVHAAVCVRTGLPVAWEVRTARTHESSIAKSVLDRLTGLGFAPTTVTLDKGYDVGPVYEAVADAGALPVIPLRKVRTNTPPGPPTCEHGIWTFAGADFKRGAGKWPPRVWTTNRADRDLADMSAEERDAVDLLILRIGADPRAEGHHLKGSFYCRWASYTDANRRVLYRIEGGSSERVVILAIPHRTVAYPRTRR